MDRPVRQRRAPSASVLTGDSADVYFARADEILASEGLDPVVVMEVFTRQSGILCGIDEAKVLLAHVLADAPASDDVLVEALDDGDTFSPREVVLRIRARYRRFGLYETAILGMLSQSTGWATAARACVEAAAPEPVISFGARHVHPAITDTLDYAAIVGGCVGASTPAGRAARRASPRPARCPIRWCSSLATPSARPRHSTVTCQRTCRASCSSTPSRTRRRRRCASRTRSATGSTASASTLPPSVAA